QPEPRLYDYGRRLWWRRLGIHPPSATETTPCPRARWPADRRARNAREQPLTLPADGSARFTSTRENHVLAGAVVERRLPGRPVGIRRGGGYGPTSISCLTQSGLGAEA